MLAIARAADDDRVDLRKCIVNPKHSAVCISDDTVSLVIKKETMIRQAEMSLSSRAADLAVATKSTLRLTEKSSSSSGRR